MKPPVIVTITQQRWNVDKTMLIVIWCLNLNFFLYVKIKLCLFNEVEERCEGKRKREHIYIYIYIQQRFWCKILILIKLLHFFSLPAFWIYSRGLVKFYRYFYTIFICLIFSLILFIYFGCAGSWLMCWFFSSCSKWGLLKLWCTDFPLRWTLWL